MLQLKPPLPRIVIKHADWHGPTGKCVANFIIEGSRDDDLVWVVDFCDSGEIWCVRNRFVRAPQNVTYGRVFT